MVVAKQQDVALQMLVSGFCADPSSSWLITTPCLLSSP